VLCLCVLLCVIQCGLLFGRGDGGVVLMLVLLLLAVL
jgi:hypothetical protein